MHLRLGVVVGSHQNLQAHVLIDRPENVREYMIEYLTNMKKVRAASTPGVRPGASRASRASRSHGAALRLQFQDEEGQFDPELVPSSVCAPASQTQPRSGA